MRALLGLYRENSPRFYWCVTWLIDFICNQSCSYCFNKLNPALASRKPDFKKALSELIRVKPKHLCISGGEPTLVPDIVTIIKQLREGVGEGMQLEFNSNCTGRPHLLHEILPYANILAASIDGVGKINKAQRGVDGDEVLAMISEVALQRYPSGSRFRRIMAVPTATVRSYPQLPLLFERLKEIKKNSRVDITVEVKPLSPYTDPMSPVSEPRVWQDFLSKSTEWCKHYKDLRIEVRGLSTFSPLDKSGVKSRSRCWRQFFTAMIWPEGNWTYCKPDWFSSNYFFPSYAVAGRREKLMLLLQSVYSLYVNICDLTCYAPCEHGENLDMALQSARASEIAMRAKEIGITLSSKELADVCSFIKNKCNPALVMDI